MDRRGQPRSTGHARAAGQVGNARGGRGTAETGRQILVWQPKKREREGGRKDRLGGDPTGNRGNLQAGQLEGFSGCGVADRLQCTGLDGGLKAGRGVPGPQGSLGVFMGARWVGGWGPGERSMEAIVVCRKRAWATGQACVDACDTAPEVQKGALGRGGRRLPQLGPSNLPRRVTRQLRTTRLVEACRGGAAEPDLGHGERRCSVGAESITIRREKRCSGGTAEGPVEGGGGDEEGGAIIAAGGHCSTPRARGQKG